MEVIQFDTRQKCKVDVGNKALTTATSIIHMVEKCLLVPQYFPQHTVVGQVLIWLVNSFNCTVLGFGIKFFHPQCNFCLFIILVIRMGSRHVWHNMTVFPAIVHNFGTFIQPIPWHCSPTMQLCRTTYFEDYEVHFSNFTPVQGCVKNYFSGKQAFFCVDMDCQEKWYYISNAWAQSLYPIISASKPKSISTWCTFCIYCTRWHLALLVAPFSPYSGWYSSKHISFMSISGWSFEVDCHTMYIRIFLIWCKTMLTHTDYLKKLTCYEVSETAQT